MADLVQAVANLQVAVQGVVDRVGPTVDQLKIQVASGQQALADFHAADEAEDTDYQAQIANLEAALQAQIDGAQSAADTIEGSVATLNTIVASEPTGPTGPTGPVEPPVE